MSARNLQIVAIIGTDKIPFINCDYCVATVEFYSQPSGNAGIYGAIVFKAYDPQRDPHTLIPELIEQFVHLMTLDDQKARGIFDIHPDRPFFFNDVRVLEIIEGTPRVD